LRQWYFYLHPLYQSKLIGIDLAVFPKLKPLVKIASLALVAPMVFLFALSLPKQANRD
jgi:hypothetical protein